MYANQPSQPVPRLERLPVAAAAIGIAVGLAALSGWQWDIAALRSILPGLVAMNPLTAIGFVLAGLSLVALRYFPTQPPFRTAGLVLATTVTLVGILKLCDLVWGGFHLDQWLFHAKLGQNASLPPNRMAPNTALNFAFLGLALLTLRVELRWGLRPSQLFVLVPTSFAFLAILGYTLDVHQLYGLTTYIPMALNTALTFAMLSVAILFAYPDRGITRVFVADDAGGAMARRVAPLALVLPAVLAWIRIHAQRAGLIEVEYGVSVMVFASSLLLTGLLWFNAMRLSGAEAGRKAALSELQEAHRVLDQRVRERTVELEDSNRRLRSEIDERVRAEEALRGSEARLLQSQKMEAIGLLAGGVAHDFNNLLTVIMGYSQLMRHRLGPDAPALGDAEEIFKAADRAATLTRQLLAFSRQQVLQPRVLDLNTIVADMDKMFRRVIGEDIDLLTAPATDLGPVKSDPGQIEQVLMNLVVNARDSMPEGGKLTIETANVDLGEDYPQARVDLKPGRYAMVAVSDTGCGMSPEVVARIFEPFYTTKEQGKGTGLGLSTVHGIIKQSEGHIEVYSEPGSGTTFKIYLPQVEGVVVLSPAPRASVGHDEGSETILLVEDEEVIRRVVTESLERQGYKVIAVEDGSQAIAICERQDQVIDLLLTDVVMPLMSGPQLVQRVASLRPALRVLYVSGYTDRALVHQGQRATGTAFLQKPFAPDALARKVREVLDDPLREAA